MDLHNNYDFVSFYHSNEEKKAIFTWRRAIGDWMDMNGPMSVQLCFDKVSLFRHENGDPDLPESEGKTISYIGFMHPRDIVVMNAYCENMHIDDSYHFVFGLENEEAFKIGAKTVLCNVGADV